MFPVRQVNLTYSLRNYVQRIRLFLFTTPKALETVYLTTILKYLKTFSFLLNLDHYYFSLVRYLTQRVWQFDNLMIVFDNLMITW